MTHTPGPLTIKGPSKELLDSNGAHEGADYAILDKDGKIIAETCRHVGYEDIRPAYANAVLFAAAPDLLEACKALASTAETAQMENYFGNDWHGVLERAYAAITSATDDDSENEATWESLGRGFIGFPEPDQTYGADSGE